MKSSIAILALSAISASAVAQTGTYTWQVSGDDGFTWDSLLVAVPNSTIKVRLLASFSGISGPFAAFAGSQFDATLSSSEGRVGTISNISRPFPFQFSAQTLVSREFSSGSLVKIDIASDVALPGSGIGWVGPGQPNFDFSGGNYVTDNPVMIFSYDLTWEGNSTDIGMVLNPFTGRAMALFTTNNGNTIRLNAPAVSINTARIVIPGPATALVIGLAVPVLVRRRRGTSAATHL